mgnify:CR=1 FL=1
MQGGFFLLQNPVNCIRKTVEIAGAGYRSFFLQNPVSCIWETVEIDGAEYRSFFVAKTW